MNIGLNVTLSLPVLSEIGDFIPLRNVVFSGGGAAVVDAAPFIRVMNLAPATRCYHNTHC